MRMVFQGLPQPLQSLGKILVRRQGQHERRRRQHPGALHGSHQLQDALRLHGGLAVAPHQTDMIQIDVRTLDLQMAQELLEIEHGDEVDQFLREAAETVAQGKGHFLAGRARWWPT